MTKTWLQLLKLFLKLNTKTEGDDKEEKTEIISNQKEKKLITAKQDVDTRKKDESDKNGSKRMFK